MNPASIGLAFIFRDDATTISAFLDSFLQVADQVVAVDTGSSDGSREIVEKALAGNPSATILDYQWSGRDDSSETLDNFAAARQYGWEKLRTEWGLWGDSDDTLDDPQALRRLAAQAPEQVGAFVFEYNYAQVDGVCVCTLWRERLLRMSVGWTWTGNVHEVLIPGGQTEFMQVPSPSWIHHKIGKPSESDRNLKIIEKHIADAASKGVPADPRMIVYHGTELAGRGRHAEAVEAFKSYMQVSQWGEEKHQAMHRMADSLRALGSHDEAMQVETYAITHAAAHEVAEWPDHFHGIGECLMALGKPGHALAWFDRALQVPTPKSNLILNPRDYDYMPHFQLSVCYAQLGDFDKAVEHASIARSIMPNEGVDQNLRLMMVNQRKEMTIKTSLAYLESLIRFDENAKAREAVRTLPYVVRNDPRVRQMVNHIRLATFQIGSEAGYEQMYATNREVRNPDDFVDNADERFSRVGALVKGIREQKAVLPPETPFYLLDAGCNDGWVAAHVESVQKLAVADGIDLNPVAIAAAKDRAERFGLLGRYETGFVESAADVFGENRYDAIAMFEVFEHLEDTHRSVGALERALKRGGRMYISTPIGAFEHGMIDNWQANLAKQHLRAVVPTEFARFAMLRGNLADHNLGHEGVQTISYTPSAKKGRICFYIGVGAEPWSPTDINGRGLGGSETAATRMATGLAEKGWFVEIFGGFSVNGPVENVLWRDESEYDPEEHYDVLISSRVPQVIDLAPNADRKILWCHDAHVGGGLTVLDRASKWDEVWVLSESHEKSLREFEKLTDERWDEKFRVTRNGIDLDRYKDGSRSFSERSAHVIYSSSPDRGLGPLLEMWPEVRKAVPKAKLKVYYGFDIFDRIHRLNPEAQQWKRETEAKLQKMKKLGVEYLGRTPQDKLAVAQQQARVWAYPYTYGSPTETSCITAMESMAAGLFPVTTFSGALPETIGTGIGAVIGGTNENFPYKEFVRQIIRGLTDEASFTHSQHAGLQRASELTWDALVEQWDEILSTAVVVV
jgi:glycosyltransferase involved in cell wall biosynthesis/2-polyprenyl-3-methyl-5-hydroxy-6-metoxy-1,4-benzoquinol methylase/tetratricopeptide (TPR) repeat protein